MTLLPSPSLDILFFIVRQRDVATETKRRGKKAKEEDPVAGTSLTSSAKDLLVTAVVAVRRGSGYDDYADSSQAKRAVRVEFCIRKHRPPIFDHSLWSGDFEERVLSKVERFPLRTVASPCVPRVFGLGLVPLSENNIVNFGGEWQYFVKLRLN